MRILKFVTAIGLTGLSLAGCVDGGGYNSGYVVSYDSGYDGGYRYDRGYDNYSYRRWDDRGDYRRPDWQGQRRDRNPQGQRSDNYQAQYRPQPNRQPDRQNYPPQVRDSNVGPYSPDSCGQLDCTGLSTRGSNR